MNRKIMGTESDPYYGAPTFVLVFASPTEKWRNSIQDGSLVLGNMMNAARAEDARMLAYERKKDDGTALY